VVVVVGATVVVDVVVVVQSLNISHKRSFREGFVFMTFSISIAMFSAQTFSSIFCRATVRESQVEISVQGRFPAL
jgi:hypothetical protein